MTDWLPRAWAAIDVDRLIQLTVDLVRFPSATPPGREEPIARFLEARFRSLGLATERQEIAPGRSNVIGRLGPAGSRPHLVLNGHLDVVPEGAGWSFSPFEPMIADGRIYGRGAADMKGGLAAVITAVAAVVAAGAPLTGPITLAAVADEEDYQAGTRRFIETVGSADFAVVAEPTGLRPAIAQKGQIYLEVTTRGRAAHASAPETGHNAIYDMGIVLAALEEAHQAYTHRTPHPLLGYPSLSVGTIDGGTVTPVVPDRCRITIDRRTLPGEDPRAVQAEFEAVIRAAGKRRAGLDATVRTLWTFAASEISPNEPVVRALQAATRLVRGAAPAPFGLAGTTDANLLIDPGGIPTAIFGPGDLSVCHQPDEYVPIDELVDACKIYVATILSLLGPPA